MSSLTLAESNRAFAVLAVLIFLVAAVSDWRHRYISNMLVAALLVLVCFRSICLGTMMPWWQSILFFVFALPFFSSGVVGGGDIKLMAAAMLWLPSRLPDLFVGVGLIGGVVAVLYAAISCRSFISSNQTGGRGIPYGVAISIATSVEILHTNY